MKRGLLMLGMGLLSGGVWAVFPQVSNVVMSQDSGRVVSISYDLAGAPAVITADVLTNGVSIGVVNFTNMVGAVNQRVEVGVGKQISWRPWITWPDRKIAAGEVSVRVTAWPVNDPPDYQVVDLQSGESRFYVSPEAFPGGFWANEYRTKKLVMKKIEAAMKPFVLGTYSLDIGYQERWATRKGMLTNDFYIGVFEFTQGQWRTLCGSKMSQADNAGGVVQAFTFDSDEDSELKPVNHVNYNMLRGNNAGWGMPNSHAVDAWSAMGKLRTLMGQAASDWMAVDLPSQMEWEFACRGGADSQLPDGFYLTGETVCTNLSRYAYYKGTGGDENKGPYVVGSFQSNQYGLYDMLGNVAEICRDWFVYNCASFPEVDYEGATRAASQDGGRITACGGAFVYDATNCQCGFRVCPLPNNVADYYYGFRVVLRLP